MIFSVFGLAGGIGMPMQTSINAQLGRRVGSPFLAALINFTVGIIALIIVTAIVEHGLAIPVRNIIEAPLWIMFGGAFAVVFVTGNILLMPRIGSVQTSILPAMGQILMGTLIDTFGWFQSALKPMSFFRGMGVVLVVLGVFVVIMSKSRNNAAAKPANASSAKPANVSSAKPANASGSKPASANTAAQNPVRFVWLWRAFGLVIGMCMASQTAVNSHLSVVVDSKLFASVINFTVGLSLLIILNIILIRTKKPGNKTGKAPAWILTGGLFGALFVIGNILTAQALGTGMAVVILLTGLMIGGLLVDQFGLFRSARRPVSIKEIFGVLLMVAGAILFHLM